jgi:PqqD family protein of HPr-rel-A system
MANPSTSPFAGRTLPRRSGYLTVIGFDSESVVHDPVRSQAHLLNQTAALILERCDGEAALDDLVGELAAEFGAEPEIVDRDVRALLVDLRDRRLLDEPGSDDEQATIGAMRSAEPARPSITPEPPHDPGDWVSVSPTFPMLDAHVRIRTDNHTIGRYVDQVLASLITAGPTMPPPPDGDLGELSVRSLDLVTTGNHIRILVDGVEVGGGHDLDSAVTVLHWQLNQLAIEATSTRVLLHASAVQRRDGVAVFPAESNSGKSTLAAGLVRAGFGYVTDEAVAVDPPTGLVIPFPKPISLDPGSWPLFPEHRPAVTGAEGEFFHDQWHLDPRVLDPDALTDLGTSQSVTLVAFPEHVEGAPTTAVALRPAEVLLGLLRNAFNLAEVGPPGVAVLARIARDASGVRLTVGDLDDAVRLIRSIP